MSHSLNPWALLDVKAGDAEDVLRTQYKRTMMKVHPDRPGGSRDLASITNRCYEMLLEHLVNGCVPSLEDLARAGLPVDRGHQRAAESPKAPAPPRPPQPHVHFCVPHQGFQPFWGSATTTSQTTTTNNYRHLHVRVVMAGHSKRRAE